MSDERKSDTHKELMDHLARIELRLPDPEGEFPVDRHLREIRDQLKEMAGKMNDLFYIRRNGSGRDGLVPGLNRVEDRVSTIMKMLWIILVAFTLGVGGLFMQMIAERVKS